MHQYVQLISIRNYYNLIFFAVQCSGLYPLSPNMTKCECEKTSTRRLFCHFGQACMGDDGAKECVDGCLHPEFSFLRTSNTYDNHELYEETHTLEYTYRSWDNIFYPPGKHNFSCMPGFGVAKFQASEIFY